jgi:hypothetical protein
MRALHLHTPMGTGRLPAGGRARTRRIVSNSLDEYSCTRQFGRSRAHPARNLRTIAVLLDREAVQDGQ